MYQYPYGNAQQLNLDWILGKIQEIEAGATEVNIEEVANALVSASFDAGVSYRRYDYCFYNGKLYRALNDTSGAFNPSDWLEVVLGDDIPVLTRLLNAVDASVTSLQTTVGNQGNDITNLQNALGDLDSDDVDNASLVVSGATVTAALDNLNNAITSLGSDDVVNDSTKITAATVTAALNALYDNIKTNTAWKNVSGFYGTLQAYYYESSTAISDFDVPENYVYVLCMQYKATRGAAIAIRWQSGAYRMWINTLHDTWSGWHQITPYTTIDRFTLTDNCWGVWGPASTTLASYTIPETGFYDIWFCPTVNIRNDNATRLRLYADSTIVAFGQVGSPNEVRLPLALRHMGQLTAGTVITLQCQCDVSTTDLRMLFASAEGQPTNLMNHFVHRIY